MTPDDLERILSAECTLEPSSGFAMAAMDAVRRQAAEPPRPFPWIRFATGMAACAVMAAAGTVLLGRFATILSVMAAPLASIAGVAPELGYATAALLLSVALASMPRLLGRY